MRNLLKNCRGYCINRCKHGRDLGGRNRKRQLDNFELDTVHTKDTNRRLKRLKRPAVERAKLPLTSESNQRFSR